MEQTHAIWVVMVDLILETLVMSGAILATIKLVAWLECAQQMEYGMVEKPLVSREVSSYSTVIMR